MGIISMFIAAVHSISLIGLALSFTALFIMFLKRIRSDSTLSFIMLMLIGFVVIEFTDFENLNSFVLLFLELIFMAMVYHARGSFKELKEWWQIFRKGDWKFWKQQNSSDNVERRLQ